jgi:hypothetical protein
MNELKMDEKPFFSMKSDFFSNDRLTQSKVVQSLKDKDGE